MQHHLIVGEETVKLGEPLIVHDPAPGEDVGASPQTGGGRRMGACAAGCFVPVGRAHRGRAGEPGAVVDQREQEATLRVEGGAGRRSGYGAVRRW